MSIKVCKILYHPEVVVEASKTYLGFGPLLVAGETPDCIPLRATCTGTFRAWSICTSDAGIGIHLYVLVQTSAKC